MKIEDIDMTVFNQIIGTYFHATRSILYKITDEESFSLEQKETAQEVIIDRSCTAIIKHIRLALDCNVDDWFRTTLEKAIRGEIDVNDLYRSINTIYIDRLSKEEERTKERLKAISDKKANHYITENREEDK